MEPLSQKTLIGIGVVVVILLAVVLLFTALQDRLPAQEGEEENIFCTLDAKLCPDGSYVGRVPPTCEFASCPGATSTPSLTEMLLETRIDEGASGLGVKVIPHTVLEDSRCPADVTCIQAGTVRIRATLESGLGTASQIFMLGQPVTTEAENVELIEVRPEARSGQWIAPADYRFIFKVTKRFGGKG